jgi:hypothetical protein
MTGLVTGSLGKPPPLEDRVPLRVLVLPPTEDSVDTGVVLQYVESLLVEDVSQLRHSQGLDHLVSKMLADVNVQLFPHSTHLVMSSYTTWVGVFCARPSSSRRVLRDRISVPAVDPG